MTSSERFYIDSESGYAVLLGYVMRLTKAELAILKYIKDHDGYVSAQELTEKVSAGRALTVGSVAVHVCNINKKATNICGKPIVKVRRFKGYCI